MVRRAHVGDGVARGCLPAHSAPGRAVGEDTRGQRPTGEGVRRQPGNARSPGSRPRSHAALAEVVLSVPAAQPERDYPGQLETGPQAAADQSVLADRRADHGPRPGWRTMRGARWNSPRSASMARTGGPLAWKRPAAPSYSEPGSRPPPRSCSRMRYPVASSFARMTPPPMRSGSEPKSSSAGDDRRWLGIKDRTRS